MDIGLIMPSLDNGGVQKVIVNLSNGFARNGLKVNMIIGNAEGKTLHRIDERIKIYDFKKKARGDFKMLLSINKLRKYIKNNKNSIMIAAPGFSTAALIIANLTVRNKCKTILMVDNKLSLLKKKKLYHKISYYVYKLLYRFADCIVAAHDNARDDIINNINIEKEKVIRIYHPLVEKDLIEIRYHHPNINFYNDSNYIILSVGRLVKEKDFNNLIRAFKLLDIKNKKLIIVGEGEERETLEQLINELGLTEDVILYGYDNNPYRFMQNASLFVSSSKEEAFGNAIVEALSCKLKVVATDCDSGGPREILKDGNYGILCKPKDEIELKKAIEEAKRKEFDKEELKLRGLQFSTDNSIREYLKVIRRMINE
jgi:glycosyltransferase involved in cell wall biosynthesis